MNPYNPRYAVCRRVGIVYALERAYRAPFTIHNGPRRYQRRRALNEAYERLLRVLDTRYNW